MAEQMTPERLAEIRRRAESVKTWKGYYAEPVPQLLDVDVPALLAEVERLGNVIGGLTTVTGTVVEERDRLAEQVKRVRALHRPAAAYLGDPDDDDNLITVCTHCEAPYPCSTIRTLDGAEAVS